MKRNIIILIFLHFSQIVLGQTQADSLFSLGGKLHGQKDFKGAIECFKIVAENYPKFKYYNQTVYNLAYTYDNIDSNELATFWYEKIRASNVKDNERIGGRGIFEPYANYKYYSTFNIANIEYNKGNFENALDYYRQCETKYPYFNESGTDIRIQKNTLTIYMVNCLKKLKKFDEAIITILPRALDSYGSSNYKSIISSTIKLIDSNFNRKEIMLELDKAFNGMKYNKKKKTYTLKWRDNELVLNPYARNDIHDIKTLIEQIKQTEFWKQLLK